MAWYDFFAPSGGADQSQGVPWFNLGMGGLAGGASLAGLISNIYGGVQQNKALNQYLKAARAPVDPSQYYQQMTDAEMRNMRNMVGADLAARGVQPGGYWDAQMMDASTRAAQERMNQAYNRAFAAKSDLLTSLAGKEGEVGKMFQFGDMSAIGKYLQYLQEQKTRDAARRAEAAKNDQWMKMLGGQQGGPVDTRNIMPQTPYSLGMPPGSMNLQGPGDMGTSVDSGGMPGGMY